ncbi:MAG TPA: hypothetical protein VJ861_03375, partial [Treponemataceae bacterium]|nr:hypothetical protein [Treponemataceae bacterium]
MKKNIVISATAVMCTLFSFLFVSCPSGLDPSWKNNNKPIFSLDFSNSSLSDGAGSRALIQGEGFLYIRTVGSATGIKGSFYGPYTVLPGKTFSTTEIPAGSYTGLAVIYSATEANSVKVLWNGEDFTFSQFMNLPDAEFMEVVDAGEEAEEFKMEEFFDSDASGNMIQNVTITAGQENTVKITLEPMVQAGNKGNFEGNDGELQTLDFPLESETVKKQFFALGNAPSGVFSYTTSHQGGENIVIQKTALYDWRGNFLTTWNSAESIENPNSFDLPTNLENKDLYFYIEYSGDITLRFFVEPVEEPEGNDFFVSQNGNG